MRRTHHDKPARRLTSHETPSPPLELQEPRCLFAINSNDRIYMKACRSVDTRKAKTRKNCDCLLSSHVTTRMRAKRSVTISISDPEFLDSFIQSRLARFGSRELLNKPLVIHGE